MPREMSCDVLVVGGGLGGVPAALCALRLGRRVVLTESTRWVGGQLTSQGVPPDEHPWIESGGATASYRAFRTAVRDHYRRTRPLRDRARADPHLNPGQGWVSTLCHEPAVGAAVLRALLAPHEAAGSLEVLMRHRPVAATVDGDLVGSVTLAGPDGDVVVLARFVLDATEEGDLLDLAGCEHVVGAESQNRTGEPHALPGDDDPIDQQAITWCFALEHARGGDHRIGRPDGYDFWSSYRPPFWPGPQLGWATPDPGTGRVLQRPLFAPGTGEEDLWTFRRIVHAGHYRSEAGVADVTLVNWPQVDHWLDPIVGVPAERRAAALAGAKEQSRCFLYWLQNDAPGPDGSHGFPGLKLQGDVLGTSDGYAMRPYVRESRRIRACFTVLETHVGVGARAPLRGAARFADSVGVGSYRIDLHPSTAGRGYLDIASWPFQIPLGGLVPVRMRNLLPAGKNLGVTHITNGCYRLHPVEWNVGEAAGGLAAHCIDQRLEPRAVLERPDRVDDLQRLLTGLGFQLEWPEEIRLQPR